MSQKILFMGDVADSTAIDAPAYSSAFQALERAITSINRSVKADLPLSLQYGDEVSGLYETPGDAWQIATQLRDALHPTTALRFVVVRGKVGRLDSDIRKVGGQIFKVANTLMTRAKHENRFGLWRLNDEEDKILDALTAAASHLWREMSSYQENIYRLRRQGRNYKDIQAELDKHQQSVSKAAQRGGIEIVIEAEQAIEQVLKKIAEN